MKLSNPTNTTNLCYKNGLEPSTISRIEKGLVEPKLLTIMKLANALEVDFNTLLGGK